MQDHSVHLSLFEGIRAKNKKVLKMCLKQKESGIIT